MAEPDWTKILDHLYRENGVYTTSIGSDGDEELDGGDQYQALTQNLRDDLNLYAETHDEIHAVINHLGMNDLIREEIDRRRARILLQPDGFDVAHDRELAERQTQTNLMLVILTLALVMATIVGNQPNPSVQRWGGILVLGLIVIAIHFTDIFALR